jgi:phosphopantothenoylcysteine decarboxylase/phosphopantothenate--cysteine ligase
MRLLMTAGPTREPIDAVRFISNRSTGKMGLALASAGAAAGHDVTLLLGPGPEPHDLPPQPVRTYRFESSAELKQLLEAHFRDCDALIMAAAVSDYRPENVSEGKLPSDKAAGMVLRLAPTPDLVALMASIKRADQRVVAFALEEAAAMEERALAKMRRKGVDAIVANPLGTMESGAISAVWLTARGEREQPPRMAKTDFARWLIGRVESLLQLP